MKPPNLPDDAEDDCWNVIGVWSPHIAGLPAPPGVTTQRCAILDTVVHCRNCEVFVAGGRGLLERQPPSEYLTGWADVLAREKVRAQRETVSVVVFRVGEEWLAIATAAYREVTTPRETRRIPHRTDDVLLGIVSVRGELNLCISLSTLLGIASDRRATQPLAGAAVVQPRLLVLAEGNDRWAIPVDEVVGIQRLHPGELRPAPTTVVRTPGAFTRALFHHADHEVAWLDEALLFRSMRERLGTT